MSDFTNLNLTRRPTQASSQHSFHQFQSKTKRITMSGVGWSKEGISAPPNVMPTTGALFRKFCTPPCIRKAMEARKLIASGIDPADNPPSYGQASGNAGYSGWNTPAMTSSFSQSAPNPTHPDGTVSSVGGWFETRYGQVSSSV